MSTTIKTVLVLAVAFAAGALFLRVSREGGASSVTLEEGLRTARAEQRPVFLYFGASW